MDLNSNLFRQLCFR